MKVFAKLKDHVYMGFLIAMLIQAVLFMIVYTIKKKVILLSNDDLGYIACVAFNLIPLKLAFKYKKEAFARGVIAASFIGALVFVYYKLFFKD